MTNPATEIFTQRESEVRSYCRNWPVVFDTAKGVHQTTEDGEVYTDFFSGAGALNYGHNNDVLKQALLDYVTRDGVTHSMDMHTKAKRDFLETFTEVILEPRGMTHKIQFPGPTGTNAVETALKTARKVTGREEIVSFTNAFHGMTLGSLAVTGNAFKRAGAGTPLYHATSAPYDDYIVGETSDFAWLKRIWADSGSGHNLPAAVIVETVQGEGGVRAARAEWLRELSALCKKHDILLIVDDVQAGQVPQPAGVPTKGDPVPLGPGAAELGDRSLGALAAAGEDDERAGPRLRLPGQERRQRHRAARLDHQPQMLRRPALRRRGCPACCRRSIPRRPRRRLGRLRERRPEGCR